jgi:Transposase zinc-binding domain
LGKPILPELEADIVRCYRVDKLRAGTIARQLHVRHGTVVRVLAQAGMPRADGSAQRPSIVDDYVPLIRHTLERFPTLAASRIYKIVCEHGYRGSPDHFRHLISCIRPPFDPVEWMLAVLQKKIGRDDLIQDIGDFPDLTVLLHRLYTGRLSDRNRALAILASQRELTIDTICTFLGISPHAYTRYKRVFSKGGSEALFSPQPAREPLWQCAQRHGRELREAGRFQRKVEERAIERFIKCGDPHYGFAWIYCEACGHDYLPAFSCKAWYFGPSCHQKRVLL